MGRFLRNAPFPLVIKIHPLPYGRGSVTLYYSAMVMAAEFDLAPLIVITSG